MCCRKIFDMILEEGGTHCDAVGLGYCFVAVLEVVLSCNYFV